MTRRLLLAALALAAAGILDVFGPDGQRIGTLRDSLGGSVDLYDTEGRRVGWGRRNADGSVEVLDLKGNRLGTITRDGRAILFAPLRPQERR
jgi:hypothetical protein